MTPLEPRGTPPSHLPDPLPSTKAAPSAVTALRGARVEVDSRRVGRALMAIGLAVLVGLTVTFYVVGARKNEQISELRGHGVRVVITVTNCVGLLGGSGSNDAGYACRGAYVLDGHRYVEAIPGDTLRQPGTSVQGVATPDAPGLVTTVSELAGEHASWRVYIAPTALLAACVVAIAALVVRRRLVGARSGRA